MLKLTLNGLLASRARLVLTAVAVVIGVALVAGTLISPTPSAGRCGASPPARTPPST